MISDYGHRQRPGVRDLRSAAARRFQAYNVGLAKTGTTSMAGIFARYRSAHEFMFPQALTTISDYVSGLIGPDDLRAFVLERDKRGMLEMDSASFNHSYVDILVKEFLSARFIFTIRDCYSWLDSVLNMVLAIGPSMPPWMVDHARRTIGVPFTPDVVRSREEFLRQLPQILDGALILWGTGNQAVIEAVPVDRTLILRTDEISGSIDRIAAFLDISEDTLVPQKSHLYKAVRKFDLLRDVDHDFLQERVDRYCSGVMHGFFPGYTLEDFLDDQSWKDLSG